MPKFSFENLLKISFPLIVGLSIVRVSSYYAYFDIPIISYLDVGEIATLFLQDLFFYTLLLFPIFYLSIQPFFKWKLLIFLLLYLSLVAITLLTKSVSVKVIIILAYVIGLGLLLYVGISVIVFGQKKKPMTTNEGLWAMFTFCVIGLILGSAIRGRSAAENTLKCHQYLGTEISVDSAIVRSDSNFQYIGQTKGSVFFYDAISHFSVRYPLEKVKRISLHAHHL